MWHCVWIATSLASLLQLGLTGATVRRSVTPLQLAPGWVIDFCTTSALSWSSSISPSPAYSFWPLSHLSSYHVFRLLNKLLNLPLHTRSPSCEKHLGMSRDYHMCNKNFWHCVMLLWLLQWGYACASWYCRQVRDGHKACKTHTHTHQ